MKITVSQILRMAQLVEDHVPSTFVEVDSLVKSGVDNHEIVVRDSAQKRVVLSKNGKVL